MEGLSRILRLCLNVLMRNMPSPKRPVAASQKNLLVTMVMNERIPNS